MKGGISPSGSETFWGRKEEVMKIEKIELQNFKCFKNLSLQLDRPINFVFGKNASGKSTISEALSLALTGRVNGFSLNWKDRVELSGNGTDFKITVDLEGNRIIHRAELRDCTPKPDTISRRLNASKEMLSSLFDSSHFLSLHPDEKKRLIFDLLDLKVTRSNIKKKLKSWLKERPGILEKYQVNPEEDLLKVLEKVPDSLEEGYKEAFDERRITKRELKKLAPIEDLPEVSEDTLKDEIERLKDELLTLNQRLGERRGIKRYEREQIEAEIKEIRAELERVEDEIQGFKPGKASQRLSELQKKRDEKEKDAGALISEIDSTIEKIREVRFKKDSEGRIISKLRDFDGNCPLFETPIRCKTKEVISAAVELKQKEASYEKQIKDLLKKEEELRSEYKAREEELRRIDQEISELEESISANQKNLKLRDELNERLKTLKNRLTECREDDPSEDEIKHRIKEIEAQLEEKKALLLRLEQNEKKKVLLHKLNTLEVLVQAFSPKGIMEDLLSKATESLNATLTEAMKRLTGGRYSLEMSINDDLDIHLIDHHRGTKTSIKYASASERFRAGVVIQYVLSSLTGLRFMLIDGVDILDQENKGFFFNFIKEVKDEFDTILAFCTIGKYPPRNPNLSDIDFWIIEDGKIAQIK